MNDDASHGSRLDKDNAGEVILYDLVFERCEAGQLLGIKDGIRLSGIRFFEVSESNPEPNRKNEDGQGCCDRQHIQAEADMILNVWQDQGRPTNPGNADQGKNQDAYERQNGDYAGKAIDGSLLPDR
jgi:hypothetical protein